MIIKRKKNNPENEPEISFKEEPLKEEPVIEDIEDDEPLLPAIEDRQERRRGDRRRGYRRVDDRNLISRAHEESNAIKERAAQEGFEQGMNMAKQEINRINQALDSFLSTKEEAMTLALNEISEIAIKVAEKIIKTEVACDETIVLNIVSDVLKKIGKGEKEIIVKANPSDAEIIRSNLPKIFPFGNTNAKIIIVEDNDVEWGSCLVETNNGLIDAQFSTQLSILRKALESGL